MQWLIRIKKDFFSTSTLIFIPIILMVSCGFHQYSGLAINLTNSLPQKAFILNKLEKPKVGKYVCFKAPKNSGFSSEVIITKKILAQAGDVISIQNQSIYINHQWVAKLKKVSQEGEALQPGPVGVLKEGEYYVGALHPDSLDSRYNKIGWISREQIIAVAHPIF